MKTKTTSISYHIDCDVCGTRTETKKRTIDYPYKGADYRFENMEVEVCPRCGFDYYPAPTVLAIESELAELTGNRAA